MRCPNMPKETSDARRRRRSLQRAEERETGCRFPTRSPSSVQHRVQQRSSTACASFVCCNSSFCNVLPSGGQQSPDDQLQRRCPTYSPSSGRQEPNRPRGSGQAIAGARWQGCSIFAACKGHDAPNARAPECCSLYGAAVATGLSSSRARRWNLLPRFATARHDPWLHAPFARASS